jgi:hypothetical protein
MTSFPRTDTDLVAQGYVFESKGKCRGCGADIEWWLTPKQKHIPLDAATLEPHWSTCSDAKGFRRPQPKHGTPQRPPASFRKW